MLLADLKGELREFLSALPCFVLDPALAGRYLDRRRSSSSQLPGCTAGAGRLPWSSPMKLRREGTFALRTASTARRHSPHAQAPALRRASSCGGLASELPLPAACAAQGCCQLFRCWPAALGRGCLPLQRSGSRDRRDLRYSPHCQGTAP